MQLRYCATKILDGLKLIGGSELVDAIRVCKDNILFNKQDKKREKENIKLSKLEKTVLRSIKRNGYFVLPNFIEKNQCNILIKEIEEIFDNNPQYLAHANDVRMFGINILSKKIASISRSSLMINIAKQYCPQFYFCTMAGILEYKGKENLGSGGGLHRDGGYQQIKFMLYLTDCDKENGCFEIIEKSHKPFQKFLDTFRFDLKYNNSRYENKYDMIMDKLKKRHKKITGKAGTLIAFDTSLIHAGAPIEAGKRVALTFYYTRKFDSECEIKPYLDHHTTDTPSKTIAGYNQILANLMKQHQANELLVEMPTPKDKAYQL